MRNKIVALCLLVFLSGCYTDIVDNVVIRESIKIESILIQNGILAKSVKSKDGYTIRVLDKDRLKAISLLSYYELPGKPEIDIQDLFPAGELVSSPFAEKNRLIYGVANNLKKTIETVPGVISASVDLAYATEMKSSANNKASIVIVYQSPLNVDSNFIEQIKAIVVNANPDVSYNNVSVSTFKKQYTPITKDLVNESDTNKYIYILAFLFLTLTISLVVFIYDRKHKKK